MSRILSKEFVYVPSHSTDIRKTFEKHGHVLVPRRDVVLPTPDEQQEVLKNFAMVNRHHLLGG